MSEITSSPSSSSLPATPPSDGAQLDPDLIRAVAYGRPTRGAAKHAMQKLKDSSLQEFEEGSKKQSRPSSKPRATSSQAKAAAEAGNRFSQDGILWEIQMARCLSRRYRTWRRCVSCVGKCIGDTCRFVGFRAIPIDQKTNLPYDNTRGSSPVNAAFISARQQIEELDYPSQDAFNRPPDPLNSERLQTTIAEALLSVLKNELEHAQLPQSLRRTREVSCRQMCEYCATSIFSASWFCRRCGKEFCLECFDGIQKSQDSVKTQSTKAKNTCTMGAIHGPSDFVPLTRFSTLALNKEISVMEKLVSAHRVGQQAGESRSEDDGSAAVGSTEAEIDWPSLSPRQAGIVADQAVGKLPLRKFKASELDDQTMHDNWRQGEPMLVTNVLDPLAHRWDPQAFIDRYGEEDCFIMRCDKDEKVKRNVPSSLVKSTRVGKFFESFGKSQEEKVAMLGKGSWKLKDWPPTAEFNVTFPELYQDFNKIVPAPDYTRRDGVLNLGSCYPKGVMQPDLGPKMYNAWPSEEGPGGKGTTRLHMDMADAVNIMLFAHPLAEDGEIPEEHRPGVAAWDIFRAEDADKVRQFLREEKESDEEVRDDPIHTQRYFIDAPMRVKLWQRYGVRSWRIYQKTGEAVFIPAGCAHQVCNLSDCIKVAIDFVSPENVARCFKLTSEFRTLTNEHKAWKEDVLSLRTTLWYAWCAYRRMDGVDVESQGAPEAQASSEPVKMIPQEDQRSVLDQTAIKSECFQESSGTKAESKVDSEKPTSSTDTPKRIVLDTDEAQAESSKRVKV